MALVILFTGVVVIGVAVALRGGASSGAGTGNPTLGLWGLAAGLAAVAGTAMIGQATFGWVTGFDPPGWLRIAAAWLLPFGAAAAILLGALSLRRDSSDRRPGVAGLVLALLSFAAFVLMLASVEY